MSLAFEITEEDIENVFCNNCIHTTRDLKEILKLLDLKAVEKAALYGNDLETQTNYAYDEIGRQLKTLGIL